MTLRQVSLTWGDALCRASMGSLDRRRAPKGEALMVPYLQSDWAAVAAKAMRRPEIYVHDRATYALKKVSPIAGAG